MALHEEQGAVGAELLKKFEINPEHIQAVLLLQKSELTPETEAHTATALLPELDESARKALEKAMVLAYEMNHKYIGTEHLLYGLLSVTSPEITIILKKHKLTKKALIEQVQHIIQSTSKFPNMDDVTDAVEHMEEMVDELAEEPEQQKVKRTKKKNVRALDIFAINLTDKALQKTIDPVIGRSTEIERLIHLLARRTKNNPVLVGEPGVGKTAIVEGLAKRIVEGDVPAVLKRKKIYSLDMALLISGTIYRGEFEARLKQIIDEVAKTPDAVLFVDELHNIIGAGSNQGTMDAANILKPALARGQLRCIGATTLDEYAKYIAADPALERRFQEIQVDEPSAEETVQILTGIAPQYNTYHNVAITPEAIDAAVQLSVKYVHDNYLPDKAIDLIDEAAARVRVKQPETAAQKNYREILGEIEQLQKNKEAAILAEKFDKAMALKKQEEKLLEKKKTIKKTLKKSTRKPRPVTEKDVLAVLAVRLGLKKELLGTDKWDDLDRLEQTLKDKVFGQHKVIENIIATLRRSHLRPSSSKPVATMMFVGPSGVGKTSLAKELATSLYHSPEALIQFDMSEFAEGHSVAKLLGSPAGYVGHKERNPFTEKIKKRPHAVILFDEIDKAHPDVIRLLVQMLDEGTLTDSSGKKLPFKHSIIILTSNIGAELYKSAGIGFGEDANVAGRDAAIHGKLKEIFDTSLLGRLSAVHSFEPLSHDAMLDLVRSHIDQINDGLQAHGDIRIRPIKSTLEKLAKTAYNSDTGARHAKQMIEDIIHPLVLHKMQGEAEKKIFTLKATDANFELV